MGEKQALERRAREAREPEEEEEEVVVEVLQPYACSPEWHSHTHSHRIHT